MKKRFIIKYITVPFVAGDIPARGIIVEYGQTNEVNGLRVITTESGWVRIPEEDAETLAVGEELPGDWKVADAIPGTNLRDLVQG